MNWSELRERVLANFYLTEIEMGMDQQRRKENSMTVFWLANVSICVDGSMNEA